MLWIVCPREGAKQSGYQEIKKSKYEKLKDNFFHFGIWKNVVYDGSNFLKGSDA